MKDIITLWGEKLRWFEYTDWNGEKKYILLPVYI